MVAWKSVTVYFTSHRSHILYLSHHILTYFASHRSHIKGSSTSVRCASYCRFPVINLPLYSIHVIISSAIDVLVLCLFIWIWLFILEDIFLCIYTFFYDVIWRIWMYMLIRNEEVWFNKSMMKECISENVYWCMASVWVWINIVLVTNFKHFTLHVLLLT